MANPKHLAILKRGVKVWNEWREKNPGSQPDLSGANLRGMVLVGANLHRVKLRRANLRSAILVKADLNLSDLGKSDLRGAYLNKAILTEANLKNSNISDADLSNADLFAADLSGASVKNASLIGTSLFRTILDKTNLSNAILGETVFADVNLSRVKGLTTVKHRASSTIGIDSIYRSRGRIPRPFLLGCGIPENLIIYTHSLVRESKSFFSCFVSHSTKDKRFCELLCTDLRAKAVRVWYFPEDAKWGEPVWGEIDRSIKIYDKLIVACSKNSLTSGPVLREVDRALNREDKEGKNILFPVTLDDYIFDEWEHPRKADVLAKVVGDFRGWNRSAAKYDGAFRKLLKALKAN